MRDAGRINRLLEKLRIIWYIRQDQRLGQLFVNIHTFNTDNQQDMFQVEDNVWEELIDKKLLSWDKGIRSGNGDILFRDRCWLVTKDELYED